MLNSWVMSLSLSWPLLTEGTWMLGLSQSQADSSSDSSAKEARGRTKTSTEAHGREFSRVLWLFMNCLIHDSPSCGKSQRGELLVRFGLHITKACLQDDELSHSSDRYMTPGSPLNSSNCNAPTCTQPWQAGSSQVRAGHPTPGRSCWPGKVGLS